MYENYLENFQRTFKKICGKREMHTVSFACKSLNVYE